MEHCFNLLIRFLAAMSLHRFINNRSLAVLSGYSSIYLRANSRALDPTSWLTCGLSTLSLSSISSSLSSSQFTRRPISASVSSYSQSSLSIHFSVLSLSTSSQPGICSMMLCRSTSSAISSV